MILITFHMGWLHGMQSSSGKQWLGATSGDPDESLKTIGLINSSEKCLAREDRVKHLHPPSISSTHGGWHSIYLQRISRLLDIGRRTVDSLGDTPLEMSDATIQLVNTDSTVPTVVQHLPTIMVERNQIEHHQMRLLLAENPQAKWYKWVTMMWVHWIDSFGGTISPWLAGHDAKNEGAGGWNTWCGILPNFRVVGPTSPSWVWRLEWASGT